MTARRRQTENSTGCDCKPGKAPHESHCPRPYSRIAAVTMRKTIPLPPARAITARRPVVKWIKRTFRDGAEGVLVYGSTVGPNYAANAVRGMQGYAPAVIEGHWNALTIFDALLDRLPPAAAAMERDEWRNGIDAVTLQLALQEWLAGP